MKTKEMEKTASIKKYGQGEYLVINNEACNEQATFSFFMKDMFHDCMDKFVRICIDELPIFIKDL